MQEADGAASVADGLAEPEDGLGRAAPGVGGVDGVFGGTEGAPGGCHGDDCEEGEGGARDEGEEGRVREGVDVVEGEGWGEAEGGGKVVHNRGVVFCAEGGLGLAVRGGGGQVGGMQIPSMMKVFIVAWPGVAGGLSMAVQLLCSCASFVLEGSGSWMRDV